MDSVEVKLLKNEVKELREAFMVVIEELKRMRTDFDSGLKACQKAFHLCKDAYENCEEAYNELDTTMAENCGGFQ